MEGAGGISDNPLELTGLNPGEVANKLEAKSEAAKLQQAVDYTQERYGYKFKAPISGIVYADSKDPTSRFGPGPDHFGIGAMGTYNYQTREVVVDPNNIEAHQRLEADVIEHELLHILEIDRLGQPPTHGHIIHAAYNLPERERLLGGSGIFKDNLTQKYLVGDERAESIKASQTINTSTIKELGDAFLERLG